MAKTTLKELERPFFFISSMRPPTTKSFLLLIVCTFLCSGCTREESLSDGRVRLTYWEKWTGFELEAMKKVVDLFNESQDRIYVDLLSISQIERKVIVSIAGGTPPDVAGLTAEFIPVLAQMNALYPIDGYLKKAGIDGGEDFIDIYWEECRYEDFTWALPTTGAALAYHYNKKTFRDAGLDPNDPPKSIAELAELDSILNEYSEGRIARATFLPSEPDWWPFIWPMFFGGHLWDGESQVTLTSPEVLEAYEWVASYSDRLGVERAQAFRGGFGDLFASPQNLFLSGKLYSQLQGIWMQTFVEKYSPDLEYGVAPMPTVSEDLYGVSLVECDVIFIPKGSKHPDEAFEFMEFVSSQKAAELFTTGMRSINPRKIRTPEYIENHPHPHIEFFDSLAMSDKAESIARIPIWYEMLDEMKAVFDNVWLHKAEPIDILTEAQERMQERLDHELSRWERVKEVRKESWREFVQKTSEGAEPL